jgi:diketogulonate reductase-like aldo/keto reductase
MKRPQQSADMAPEQNGTTTVPTLGFGTYRTGGYKCYNAVKNALDCGYTHIDTAMAYENEAAVGRAIEQSSVDREDIFLTTKIKGYPEMVEYERLIEAAKGCLERLGTEYLDLLLVHWWNPLADMEETVNALNTLVDDGLVDQIGVSNFSIKELKQAMRLSDAPIATNQIEYHPYWGDEELVRFCQDNDVTVTAYSPLAEGRAVEDDVLRSIGDRYGKSAAQVSIRWLIQQENVVTIPKAATPKHIEANIDVFDFELTDRDMRRIRKLEPPFWYRENREGGSIYEARSVLGNFVPDSLYNRIA